MIPFFIIATIVVFSFHLAGHLFDRIAIIPNWSSGEVDDIKRNKAFFRKGKIRTYFILMILSCFIFSLVSMLLLLNSGGPATQYAILAFALSTATSVWTLAYFVPMNKYFDAGEYEPKKLKQMVKKWVLANHLRFILLTLCLVFSILVLTNYSLG